MRGPELQAWHSYLGVRYSKLNMSKIKALPPQRPQTCSSAVSPVSVDAAFIPYPLDAKPESSLTLLRQPLYFIR